MCYCDLIFKTLLSSKESDIRYIVDHFWNCQSTLSGDDQIKNLRLIRWDMHLEWSPWNCVLLTVSEAEIHQSISNPYEVCFRYVHYHKSELLADDCIISSVVKLSSLFQTYGPLLLAKIRQRQTSARRHFSKQPIMDKYFTKGCLVISGARSFSDSTEEPWHLARIKWRINFRFPGHFFRWQPALKLTRNLIFFIYPLVSYVHILRLNYNEELEKTVVTKSLRRFRKDWSPSHCHHRHCHCCPALLHRWR